MHLHIDEQDATYILVYVCTHINPRFLMTRILGLKPGDPLDFISTQDRLPYTCETRANLLPKKCHGPN